MQNHVSAIRASIGLDPAYCLCSCWFPFPELEWCPYRSEYGGEGLGCGQGEHETLGLGSFPPLESEGSPIDVPCAAASSVEVDHYKDLS